MLKQEKTRKFNLTFLNSLSMYAFGFLIHIGPHYIPRIFLYDNDCATRNVLHNKLFFLTMFDCSD